MPDQNAPRLAGRVIEAGRTSSNGCTFSAVTIEVGPEVAQHLAGHLYGEVLIDPVGLPGDRLTSAPSPVDRRPRDTLAPGLPAVLSPGEQLVWAACYAKLIIGGNRSADAARHATSYAMSLRVIDEDEVRGRSGLDVAGARKGYLVRVRGKARGMRPVDAPSIPPAVAATAVTCDPRIRSGWPCIAGTRLGVELVAESIGAGETVEQYAADKDVTVDQVLAALEIYEGMRPLFEALDAVADKGAG